MISFALPLLLCLLLPLDLISQNYEYLKNPVILIQSGGETGAGFLIGSKGEILYFLTAAHVLEDVEDIEVRFRSQDKQPGLLVKANGDLDVAVISCARPDGYTETQTFALAKRMAPMRSEVLVIGHPYGDEWDLNFSSKIKATSDNHSSDFFTITPEGIGPGSSGAPVLNQNEQLLGMVLEMSGNKANCISKDIILRMMEDWRIPIDYLKPPKPTKQVTPFVSYIDSWVGEMILIKGGNYEMGSNLFVHEKPAHKVQISDFYLGKFEITQAQWKAIMGSNPSKFSFCMECPVESISWEDAQLFIQKLNARSQYSYRLPTEAEWEFAAGGGIYKRTKYAGTDKHSELDQFANFCDRTCSVGKNDGDPNRGITKTELDDSYKYTAQVGSYKPNPLGLHDMSGNVWEWCEDQYHKGYAGAPKDGSAWTSTLGEGRVLRGGGWDDKPEGLRITNRLGSPMDRGVYYLGLRLARDR